MLAKTRPTAILTRVGMIRPTTHPSRFQDMQKLFDRRDHVPGKKRKKKRGGGEVEEGFGRVGCRAEPTTHAAPSFQHHFAASFLPSCVIINQYTRSSCVSQVATGPGIHSQQVIVARSRYYVCLPAWETHEENMAQQFCGKIIIATHRLPGPYTEHLICHTSSSLRIPMSSDS